VAGIDVVVPVVQGGVNAFGRIIHETLLPDSRLVPMSKRDKPLWRPRPGGTVFLQYSGYGFAHRGAPVWLLRALQARRGGIKTLGVYFHELYAWGPPWASSFWLSPVQRHVCRRLAQVADFWITNRVASARWLTAAGGEKAHAVLPVFSTIGEPDAATPAKRPWVAVFGSIGLRTATYKAAGKQLCEWAADLTLEVHDIGQPVTDPEVRRLLVTHKVTEHGHLDDRTVSCLLGEAMFGILAYPVAFAAKSSVFAAYCAHAVCPVLISNCHDNLDGLVPERHYLPDFPRTFDAAARVGNEASMWYGLHSRAVHVSTFAALVREAEGSAAC
jgi:hypothetical protein